MTRVKEPTKRPHVNARKSYLHLYRLAGEGEVVLCSKFLLHFIVLEVLFLLYKWDYFELRLGL